MLRAWRLWGPAAFSCIALAAAAGCSGGSGGGAIACEEHADCPADFICDNGSCAQVACSVTADCPTGGVCHGEFCTAQQCSALEPCTDPTHICQGGLCVPRPVDPGSDAIDAVGGDQTVGEGVTGGDTAPGDVAKPDGGTTPGGTQCAPCNAPGDCADGMVCSALTSGMFCTKPCQNDAECLPGYICYQVSAGKQCTPVSYDCAACLQTPCPEGQVCDQATDECVPALALCGDCTYDQQCGPGMRCITTTAMMHFCVTECSEFACESGFHCTEKGGVGGEGVMVCAPDDPSCCGADCPECTCEDPTPYCVPGTTDCAQCLSDQHCPAGSRCDTGTHACAGLCPAGQYPLAGNCVDCLNSSHCPEGQACDPVTHTCAATEDPCSYCVDPYPGCAEINGTWSCVPCSTSEHCGCAPEENCCNTTTYQCEGGTAANPQCNNCTADTDCPVNPNFDLRCDPGTGCCYDSSGACDNVQAFCWGPASTCKSIFEMFGAGATIPPEMFPEGGGFAGGYCSCDYLQSLMCGFMGCGPEVPQCFNGVSCSPIGTLMGLFTGMTGTSGDLCFPMGLNLPI